MTSRERGVQSDLSLSLRRIPRAMLTQSIRSFIFSRGRRSSCTSHRRTLVTHLGYSLLIYEIMKIIARPIAAPPLIGKMIPLHHREDAINATRYLSRGRPRISAAFVRRVSHSLLCSLSFSLLLHPPPPLSLSLSRSLVVFIHVH